MSLHSYDKKINCLKISLRSYFFVLIFLFCCQIFVFPQTGVDVTGTGGIHVIQGRIFYPSGRRVDRQLKVRLENPNSGDLSVFADSNGSFTFRSLSPGNYTIVVEGEDLFETARESVFIEPNQSPSGVRLPSYSRNYSVNITLRPKQNSDETKSGVIDAKLAVVPEEARNLYTQALQFVKEGKSEKAVELLNKAIILYPDFPYALNELGVQYLKQGELDKAASALQKALKLNSDDFDARLNYGIVLLQKKDFVNAETELRTAIKLRENAATPHMYLGMSLLSQKRYDEAQAELEKAINLPGGDNLASAHRFLGGIYWGQKDYQRAADELEKYLKLSPKAADAEQTRNAVKELRKKLQPTNQ